MAPRRYTRLADQVALAEKLNAERGGTLRVTELKAEYPSLVSAIYRHPHAFDHLHLEKRSPPGTRGRYLAQARALAAENGGKLPAHVDLLRIDPKLSYYIANHREEFAEFERGHTEARLTRIRAAVAEAEALAAERGGELWITKDFHAKHNKLVLTMRRYPAYFAHIPRRRRELVSLDERVKQAEKLAAENGDVLPHQGVLRREHEALRTAMTKNPAVFAHIPRQTFRRTAADLVARAKGLAEGNGGVLPHSSALERIDHSLAITIYRRPELFAGMIQEVRDSRGQFVGTRNIGEEKPVETSL
jgi:hypothetical protein